MSLGRPLLLIGGGLLLLSALAFASSDARTLSLLATSCRLGFCVVALAVPVGVMVGWLVTRTDVWGGALVERLLLLMLFVPLHLQAAGWDAGFGRQGWLSLGWALSWWWEWSGCLISCGRIRTPGIVWSPLLGLPLWNFPALPAVRRGRRRMGVLAPVPVPIPVRKTTRNRPTFLCTRSVVIELC